MKIKYSITSVVFLVIILGLSGCKEDEKGMTAIGLDKDNITLDVDAITSVIPFPIPWDAAVNEKFTWKSNNTEVARVNSKGQILGVAEGETDIVCQYGTATGKVHVKVNPIITLAQRINTLQAKGYWEFEEVTNLTKKTIGNDLVFVQDNKTITSLEGPHPDNKAVRIPRDPKSAGTTGTFIRCNHGFLPKTGEAKVNVYTIMWDIRLPNESGMPESGYYSLMSARTLDNSQDQDYCIKTSGAFGIGGLGYSPNGSLVKGKWHRVVIAVTAGTSFVYYVDGAKVYTANAASGPVDGRFSLLPEGVLFFSDEDGDDSTIDCSALAIWDKQLSDAEVKTLGSIRQTVVFTE